MPCLTQEQGFSFCACLKDAARAAFKMWLVPALSSDQQKKIDSSSGAAIKVAAQGGYSYATLIKTLIQTHFTLTNHSNNTCLKLTQESPATLPFTILALFLPLCTLSI